MFFRCGWSTNRSYSEGKNGKAKDILFLTETYVGGGGQEPRGVIVTPKDIRLCGRLLP